jgi:hypothetical protein
MDGRAVWQGAVGQARSLGIGGARRHRTAASLLRRAARSNVRGSAADDEEDALRRLADEPAFADLHPPTRRVVVARRLPDITRPLILSGRAQLLKARPALEASSSRRRMSGLRLTDRSGSIASPRRPPFVGRAQEQAPAAQVRVANDQRRPSVSETPYSRWPYG